MKFSSLSIAEIKKESQRLMKNIKRRVANIEKISGRETPATRSFRQSLEYGADMKAFEKEYPYAKVKPLFSSIKGLTNEQLKQQYRTLKYFEGLKTLSVKGAKSFHENIGPILDRVNQLNSGSNDLFWSIYNKAVEENGLLEKYKYEIMDIIYEYVAAGENDETILERIQSWFKDLYELGEEDDENIYSSSTLSR